ncbi:MAG: porphobilinogen synthase [Actinobacteria bacterium HGW-Actinobacteria-8]|nr:MAG: porphobilinogen synthase [Actinobacteria bacterium HGW-Actinobacteria-8]
MTGDMERPRRLRSTAAMRRLVRETLPRASQLVLPVFVREGLAVARPIESIPGVSQLPLADVRGVVDQAVAAGISGIMLFAVPDVRDEEGTAACAPDGILNAAIREAVDAAQGRIVIMADLCLDEFTSHGHCGVLDTRGRVDNDATLAVYERMAVAQADAGADVLGLSGMMDGQVAAVRGALERAGHHDVVVLAYSAKYASAFYGPFRDAVESTLEGDRRTYQMDPSNAREGVREARLDLAQGADIVMIKPALPYLDVMAAVTAISDVPVAAYHVSGEYAQIEAAAANGWIDRKAAHLEVLTSMVRAGADIVLTYAALDLARWLGEES